MKLKNLLISVLLASLLITGLISFASCGEVVWDSEVESIEEPVEESSSSESVSANEDECTNSIHYMHAANGRLVSFYANRLYTFTDLEYYFGAELYGLEFFDNEVITCDEAGHARFKCESCDNWVLLDVIDEHDYRYDEEATVIDEDGAEIVFTCSVCEDSQLATVSSFKVTTVNSDCITEGYKTASYKYTFNGKTVSESKVIANYTKDLRFHKYNNNVICTDDNYRLSTLSKYFGTKLEGLQIAGNSFDCANAGSAVFTCSDCNAKVVIDILEDHELVYDEENSLISEEEFTVIHNCKNCDHVATISSVSTHIEERPADCTYEGGRYLVYSYYADDIRISGEKLLGDKYTTVSTVHKYKTAFLSEDNVYTLSELEAIFGKDLKDFTIAGNYYDCTQGYGVFTCSSCNKPVVINVRGDHSYELDEESSTITAEEVSLIGLCKICEEDEVGLSLVGKPEVSSTISTCSENGKKTITFSYLANGKQKTGNKVLEEYELNAHIHTFSGNLIDDEEVHTVDSLKLIFGETFNGLNVLSEYPSCDEENAGRAEFTCSSCNQTITILIRSRHSYESVADSCLYTKDAVTLTFKCSVCEKETVLDIQPNYFYIKATSTKEGKEYITYSYELDGEEFNEEYVFTTYPIDENSHVYKGKYIDSSKVYTLEELAEIFGDDYDNLTFYVNQGNYTSFVCPDCRDLIILEVYR